MRCLVTAANDRLGDWAHVYRKGIREDQPGHCASTPSKRLPRILLAAGPGRYSWPAMTRSPGSKDNVAEG
jgi:hypothetical protein